MKKFDGGLTSIEERVYRELALGAGAIKIVVHTGQELSIHAPEFKNIFK